MDKRKIWKRYIEDWKDSTGETITMKEAQESIGPIELSEMKKREEDIKWEKKMKRKLSKEEKDKYWIHRDRRWRLK